MSDYKKWDSDDNYIQHNARLTADPEVREYDGRKLVRLKFVSEAKGTDNKTGEDRYETIWVEATVADYDADKASFLKKLDVLTIEGKPALRLWGEDGDKISFELTRARLHMPISLFAELKERGFTPGAGGKPTVGKVTKPISKRTVNRRAVVEIPDDEE